ncbi:MAG: desulfoferrodoxin [Bacillota bacterium]|nr:desulfoferrodoxin [Bacillota bacterium]
MKLEVYKCGGSDVIVEKLRGGDVELQCNGQPMEKMVERTADKATEKHVPVIEEIEGGYKVTVGTTLHPMTEEHLIEWIELVTENEVMIRFLKPGEPPVATFYTKEKALYAREYCNLHGLWKA